MSENISERENESRMTSAPDAVSDEVGQAEETLKRLRISPRKILESLSQLRIDKAQINRIESQAHKSGGRGDVEAAILDSGRSSSSSESDTEYVAVKKLRFDEENGNDQTLALLAHEVGLLNDLSHKNVVKIVGFVEDVGQKVAWIVFAWEKNGNLREFIRSTNWELPERVCLVSTACEASTIYGGLDLEHKVECCGELLDEISRLMKE
ncbi:hypothetical protein FS837_012360 [Tulasnella sp. UAMH 9824]|nr:hypothetical protein FS837_012360 [Tulasnella sp. UAMH 9824]